ncbi:hypothetical protein HMPREF9346_04395 [Escherichia coli MS 119-7]|nr:hypothetical protein HMPREF9346_04395 [Escherichia coli MS 119-7]
MDLLTYQNNRLMPEAGIQSILQPYGHYTKWIANVSVFWLRIELE